MFPIGFDKCDIYNDGWCLLEDNRDELTPLIYWHIKGAGGSNSVRPSSVRQ